MVSSAPLAHLRSATIDDVGGILQIIGPLEGEGILVLTNRRFLWVEEAGEPVTATFADTVGVAHHEHHLALRFTHDWLSIFCAKPMVAKDAARQVAVALKGWRKQQASA